ncbi:hypothetical protein [Anabaena sp. PCC 7108]|uniref:hypothetical protein n=1 Tax=Anabaena sp. PCC 7108 TaxID=163908 RepID=UPI00034C98B0|nr:hypothetical protein [Anabaena sp. PCC 7108]
MSDQNYKALALILATAAGLYFGYIQHGAERPLDYANGVVVFISGVSRLLKTDSEEK